MKKIYYSLKETGVRTLVNISYIILIVGCIVSLILLIMGFASDEREFNVVYLGYCGFTLLFSLFFYGVGICVATITESAVMRDACLKYDYQQKDIEIEGQY